MKLCKCCGQEIPDTPIIEEQPVIVGYTKRKNGFVGFNTIEIGSPIYRFQNYLYLERTNTQTGVVDKVRYNLDAINTL